MNYLLEFLYSKKNIIIIILLIFAVLVFAEERKNNLTIKPHYQTYNDSIWYPNTTAYDFKPIYNYNGNDYLALYGGIGKLNHDSLYVVPYPAYGNYKQSIESFTKVNNKIWVAVQFEGIFVFDLSKNRFEKVNVVFWENQINQDFYNAVTKGVPFYTDYYSKGEKNKYFRYLFKNTGFNYIPVKAKKAVPPFFRTRIDSLTTLSLSS